MIPTQTLNRFILAEERQHKDASGTLSDLLTSIGLGIKLISRLVTTAGLNGLTQYTDQTNVQGEIVHQLDQEADRILIELLGSSGHFGSVVSEERDDVIVTEDGREHAKYVVAFDPLDGSSNIGTNIPVGTIFAIFRKREASRSASFDDYLQSGRNLVAAGYSVYGAKTTLVYTCGNGAHGFTLDPTIGEFILTERSIRVPEKGNTFSVNEGYWSLWPENVSSAVHELKTGAGPGGKPYSGRYVGSLVADFDRTLRKGGIFMHPANSKRERGKLRLLYECLPLAFVMEQAGGVAWDGRQNILDIVPSSIHERCPFLAGGRVEVEWLQERLARQV